VATLYIAEYAAGSDGITQEPAIAEQTVAIGVGSVQSAAFNTETTLVRIHTDAICSVKFGVNPTAAATNSRMAAGTERVLRVRRPLDAGSCLKVAAITNT